MARADLTYRLTPALVAAHAGGPVVCLATQAIGQVYRLHAGGPARVPSTLRYVPSRDLIRADAIGADGSTLGVIAEDKPLLARVSVTGPLMSTAGYLDPCSGWCDGYDGDGGVVRRMRLALADADVLLVADSPGGAVIGLPECVEAIQRAKAEFGRRIYVVVTGMAASAMYWIAASIADPGEFYVRTSAMAGNIGARAAHCNEAGALAMAGLEIVDFAYPPGKIALSPNRAPTDVGVMRGNRDVMAAFEAFAVAVGAARPALTRDAIVKLDGDLPTGKLAVRKGLADAVASVDDVEAWALAQAATPGETSMTVRAEGEPAPPSKPGGQAEGAPKDEPKAGCAKCGTFRGKSPDGGDARHCMNCGTAFPEKDDDEEEPKSSKDPEAMAARAQGGAAATYAAMSVPALRAEALKMRRLIDGVASRVGARSHAEVLGAVDAVKADAVKAARYRTERNAQMARNDARERMDLLASLYTQDPAGHPRGKLVVDVVEDLDAKGNVIAATDKAMLVAKSRIVDTKPAPQWSDGPEGRTLLNLRAYARVTLGSLAPAANGSPYAAPVNPDPARSTDAPIAAAIEAAKREPAVLLAARYATDGRTLDDIAKDFVTAARARVAQVSA